jgi:uncharacterized membrane protein YkvA (DUF1232 family)
MRFVEQIKTWARRLKLEIATLYFVCRHHDTPWPVKLLGILVVAYALSPIDLIPDFIPVLGFLDEAVLLPALIWLGVRLTPSEVLAECRDKAHQRDTARSRLPRSYAGAAVVMVVWAGAAYGLWWWLKG